LITETFLLPGWRQTELTAALSREISDQSDVVIIVSNVDHERWVKHYPLLGDKLAIDLRKGVDAAVEAIASSSRDPQAASGITDTRPPSWDQCGCGFCRVHRALIVAIN